MNHQPGTFSAVWSLAEGVTCRPSPLRRRARIIRSEDNPRRLGKREKHLSQQSQHAVAHTLSRTTDNDASHGCTSTNRRRQHPSLRPLHHPSFSPPEPVLLLPLSQAARAAWETHITTGASLQGLCCLAYFDRSCPGSSQFWNWPDVDGMHHPRRMETEPRAMEMVSINKYNRTCVRDGP